MSNETNTPATIDDSANDIAAYLDRYEPKRFVGPLADLYLTELKTLVLDTLPASIDDAQQTMSTAGGFILSIDPPAGTPLRNVFTAANVGIWTNRRVAEGANGRSIETERGRINRLVRVVAGDKPRVPKKGRRSILCAPLDDNSLAELIVAATDLGSSAMRGLVAAVGCGLIGSPAVGATITVGGDRANLGFSGEPSHRIVPQLASVVAAVAGQQVCDGDWQALRRAARTLGAPFGPDLARQTYRRLVFSIDEPVAALVASFRIGYDALDGIAPHLPETGAIPGDEALVAMLRGVGCAEPPELGTF
jgi:hypothetical protein